ncbi:MAG: hypothetical protein ACKOOJ_00385, partial [Actinomycetota bacterium]
GLSTIERVLDVATESDMREFEFIVIIEKKIAEILHSIGRSDEAAEIERRISSVTEILED